MICENSGYLKCKHYNKYYANTIKLNIERVM